MKEKYWIPRKASLDSGTPLVANCGGSSNGVSISASTAVKGEHLSSTNVSTADSRFFSSIAFPSLVLNLLFYSHCQFSFIHFDFFR